MQRVISKVLTPFPDAYAFQVDITIATSSSDPRVHLRAVIQVLKALTSVNLRIRKTKCHYFKTSLIILGHRVSREGVSVDKEKLKEVMSWPMPKTGNDVERYLGLLNYFRDFIPIYSTIAAPLERMRKMVSITTSDWTSDRHAAFQSLRDALANSPILSHPDFDKPFSVATDASNVGIGAVLYQLRDMQASDCSSNRLWVRFVARALQPAERNYSATRRELLAIVFLLARFRHYLWGNHFVLYTDHKALSYLFSQKDLSPVMSGWIDRILEFNFNIIHRPGVLNILPDALSRLFSLDASSESKLVSSIQDAKLLSSSLTSDCPDEEPRPSSGTGSSELDSKSISMIDHAHLFGHFGVKATVERLRQMGHQWPSMVSDVSARLEQCIPCQRFTIVRHGFHPLTPISARLPMDHIAIDCALSFPTSPRGFNILLVIVDVCSRFEFLRCLVDKSARSVAIALLAIFC